MLPVLALLLLQARRPMSLVTFNVVGAERADPGLTATFEKSASTRTLARVSLARAFARYPASGLFRLLDTVFVADDLRWDGTQMGGYSMPGARSIWIAVGQSVDENTDRWIEDSFHHELGHVIKDQRRELIPEKAWRAANAPGFRYTHEDAGGGFGAVSSGKDTEESLDPTLNAQGLLSHYGATEFEEDWATYAERLLDPDPTFLKALRKYPRVRVKMRLITALYRRVFPGIHLRDVPPN